jgi:FMNH2-dependent dimethyl sulfone monooxygenase
MNAGGSGKGRHFAAKYADMAFTLLRSRNVEGWRAEIDQYRTLARDEYKRDLQVWTFASVVQRDTKNEADDALAYYSQKFLDKEALDAVVELAGVHSQLYPPDQFQAMKKAFRVGGGFPLFGTPGSIVQSLEQLSVAGLDGILLTWFDYTDGLSRWVRDVLPLMEQAGLRSPSPPSCRAACA